MKPRKQSMDGFVAKRPQRTSLGEITSKKTTTLGRHRSNEDSPQVSNNATRNIQQPTSANKLKQNISESLAAIDENTKQGFVQQQILDEMPAVEETKYVRHVRFSQPLRILMDGKRQEGAVLFPETN